MYSEWADTLNAQLYEQYVQTYPLYRETGSKLIELADIHLGLTVVDLACGTGVVTEQVLSLFAGTGMVIAVDQSAAMLAVAEQKFPSKMARFVHSPAETVDDLLPEESIDVVVCNAAFWQTSTRDTIEALQCLLKAGGRFLFSLPLTSFIPLEQRSPSAALPLIMSQIAKDEYGYTLPEGRKRPRLTVEEVQRIIEPTSFTLISYQDFTFEETLEDAYAFLHIPVMTQAALPGLDYATCLAIVEKAYQQFRALHKDNAVWRYEWRFYILYKDLEAR